MNTIAYQIEFFSYWHASSGLAGGAYADLLVNKTGKGLPYIPGRTLKGLLREAAETIKNFDKDLVTKTFILDVFGQAPDEKDIEAENATLEAKSFFSNAHLSDYLQQAISKETVPLLYHVLASTKINEHGVAADGTLRQIEVTVPLALFATIEQFPDKPGYDLQLNYCFQWIKRMGLNRSRGLGRCKFSIIQTSQG
jgi:CRISPR/Cas system CSM-associated protein Csm3 (group 7 of RAMP superfamily)